MASFRLASAAEVTLHASVHAPGTDRSTLAHPSAVASLEVDGRTVSNIVAWDVPVGLGWTLGRLRPGPHRVKVRSSEEPIRIADPVVVAAGPREDEVVLRHAPILFGRALPWLGGPYQNAVTDTPLVGWHREYRAPDGSRSIEYSVLFSHEDGGTPAPALMARWGRTADIEWVYRVSVDRCGSRIPGSARYQGPGHRTVPFAGRFDGDHPLLQICTANNMVCDRVGGSMRFALAFDADRPAGRAREAVMEEHPWTYQLAAAEVRRQRLVRATAGADSPLLGDPSDYLHLELAARAAQPEGVRLAAGVRLRGDSRLYRSDHDLADRGVRGEGAIATSVKLPHGTRPADIAAILVLRSAGSAGGAVEVAGITRAFFLGPDDRPQVPFLSGVPAPGYLRSRRPLSLTGLEAVLWTGRASPPAPPRVHREPGIRRRLSRFKVHGAP